jgi:hypothetical protein
MTGTTEFQTCEAVMMYDWHSSQCSRNGRHERAGHPVCKIHANKFDEWDGQDRALDMAAYYWKWNIDV